MKITVIGEVITDRQEREVDFDRQEREVDFIMFRRFNFTQSSQRKLFSGVMCRINEKTGKVSNHKTTALL